MRISSLRLSGIRAFSRPTDVPLFETQGDDPILTISGPNGSGKSAIVEALAAFQRAGILDFLRERNEERARKHDLAFKRRLRSVVASFPAEMELGLEDEDGQGRLHLRIELLHGEPRHTLRLEGDCAAKLLDDWGAQEPTNLIVTIPSTKYFNQEDVLFTRIRPAGEEVLFEQPARDQLLWPLVSDPAMGIRYSYRNLMEDWLFERLVPGKKRTLFNNLAKIFLTTLFPHIKLTNFSTVASTGETLCLTKRVDHRTRAYDVRGLSSGEKYVYFLFSMLVRYAGRVMTVVFDEPENHLHETTLSKFTHILTRFAGRDCDFPKQVQELAQKVGLALPPGQIPVLNDRCSGKPLVNSAVLVTHSKLLVRQNLHFGTNVLLADGTAEILDVSDTEEKLRCAGVSQLDERVVFVEGDTDSKILSRFFRRSYVEIRALTGKDAVCAAFEGFGHIERNKRRPGFAFLLDRDSGNDIRYDRLRSKFGPLWDQHVIVLERTELENYFLEPILFEKALRQILDQEDQGGLASVLEHEKLDMLLREAADRTLDLRKQHFLATEAANRLSQALQLPRPRDLSAVNKGHFQDAVRSTLSHSKLDELIAEMSEVFDDCEDRFSQQQWESTWRAECKGKKAFSNACRAVTEVLGIGEIHGDLLRRQVTREAAVAVGIPLRGILDRLKAILLIEG